MNKDTLIFDLDGTLLNTLEDLHAGFNYALKICGYKERSLEEIRSFVGNGIRKAIERALPEGIDEKETDKIVNIFKEYYKGHMHIYTKPYEGIVPMLIELKEKGFKLGVVSNKFDDAVKGLCGTYFNNLIEKAVGEGHGIDKKPDPKGVFTVVKQLDSSIEKTIYIGDSEVDIQTAQNTSVPCISIIWGFKDKDFLISNGAKLFANTPQDIIKIIEKKNYLS